MADDIDVITAPAPEAAPVTTAPLPAANPEAAPAAAQPASKVKDPFAAAYDKISPPAKEEPVPDDKKKTGDKGGAAPVADKTKVVAAKKEGIEEMRTRLSTVTTDLTQRDTTIKQLNERIQQMEKNAGGDVQGLTARNEELQKQLTQLRDEIGAKDYTKTEEYSTKFEAPFNQSAEYAKEVIESLTVVDVATGEERQADWKKDFAPLYQLPRAAARLQAKEKFGEDAASVMQHYDDLHRLDSVKQKAIAEWKKGSTERETQERGKSVETRQRIAQGFQKVTDSLTADDPLYQIKPDDKESQDVWNKTKAIVDKAYFEADKLTIGERITLDAAIRLKAINEPVLRQKLAKITAERDELLQRITGKQKSASGDTRKGADAAPADKEGGDFAGDLRAALTAAS